MQGTWINLDATIDASAGSERSATEVDEAYRTAHNPRRHLVRSRG